MGNQVAGQNPFNPYREDQNIPAPGGIVSGAVNPIQARVGGGAGGNMANPTGMMSAEQFKSMGGPTNRASFGPVRGMLEDNDLPTTPVVPPTPNPITPNIVPTAPVTPTKVAPNAKPGETLQQFRDRIRRQRGL